MYSLPAKKHSYTIYIAESVLEQGLFYVSNSQESLWKMQLTPLYNTTISWKRNILIDIIRLLHEHCNINQWQLFWLNRYLSVSYKIVPNFVRYSKHMLENKSKVVMSWYQWTQRREDNVNRSSSKLKANCYVKFARKQAKCLVQFFSMLKLLYNYNFLVHNGLGRELQVYI